MSKQSGGTRVALLTGLIVLLGTLTGGGAGASGLPSTPRLQGLTPEPGSRFVLPQTNILVRLDRTPDAPSALVPTVVGSASGAHAGSSRLASDGRTLVFKPDVPFEWGETVTVQIAPLVLRGSAQLPERVAFSFTISPSKPPVLPSSIVLEQIAGEGPSSANQLWPRPSSTTGTTTLPPDFPVIASTVYAPTAPGLLFLASFAFFGPNDPYLLALDNSGAPQFWRRMPNSCYDFKIQPNGRLTYYDQAVGCFLAMNDEGAIVDTFKCGNGYATDLHELRLLPNGHALLMSYDPQTVDMSAIVPGGNPLATVVGMVVQELDANKDVVFQWRSWDHFQISDATDEDLTAASIDYVHGNAIEEDTDGDLLVSCRHMDEITKIDRETGDIVWRWGGKHNEFTFVNDAVHFSHQHAIRRLPSGHVTLYDNGNDHAPQFSRAVEYSLDENAKVAHVDWEYRNSPETYGFAMGYVQRLDNGNTLIGWGAGKPDVIEVASDGTKLMELSLPAGIFSYRAYRQEWTPNVSVDLAGASSKLSLSVPRPNPVHDRAELTLQLAVASRVSMALYDVSGRLVRTMLDRAPLEAGTHRIPVDLADASPGLYFCRLTAAGQSVTRKLLLTR